MKRAVLFPVFCFFLLQVMAQVPQSFRYQAVLRDATGTIMADKTVLFRINILAGSSAGNLVYRENHVSIKTNAFGLAELEIGKGVAETGQFSAIPWGSGSYFVKIDILPSGATSWQEMGTTQLLSVPYAIFAGGVENNNDPDADPVNELQKLTLDGNNLILSQGGGQVSLPRDNWGSQVVKTDATMSGQGTEANPLGVVNGVLEPSWLKITNMPAGFADGIDNVDDADADKTNELQDLQLNGLVLGLTGSTRTVVLPSFTGDNWGAEVVKTDATLEGEGTLLKPLKLAGQAAASGQVLKWDGSSWKPAQDKSEDADSNPLNEIQTLSVSGSNLTISGANTVVLPADGWGAQVVKTNSTLTGQGTEANPLGVTNQVLTPSWLNILNMPQGFSDGIDNVDDDDHNPTNEIQNLSITDNVLTLSKDGGSVTLPGELLSSVPHLYLFSE